MKIYASNPTEATLEATEFARFPVDAHPTVLKPNSIALEIATPTTLSLKERLGSVSSPHLGSKSSRLILLQNSFISPLIQTPLLRA